MFWEVREDFDLFARIDRWKQEVAQQGSSREPPSQGHKLHHMNLRSRNARTALAEVSGNPHSRKRKASIIMADTIKAGKRAAKGGDVDEVTPRPPRGIPANRSTSDMIEDETVEQAAPRRRGRPPKLQDLKLVNLPELDVQTRSGLDSSLWSPSGPSSPRKADTSPSKRQLTINKPISEAAIDMEYLSRCNPAVHLTTFRELRVEGMDIVSAVGELFVKLQHIPFGVIPSALEVFSST